MEDLGNRGVLLCKFSMACRTRGLEEEELWICRARDRSRAPITTGSGQIAALVLSSEVSTESRWERASAGAIFNPGVTCQTISKSCRNKDHLACRLDSLRGSLM